MGWGRGFAGRSALSPRCVRTLAEMLPFSPRSPHSCGWGGGWGRGGGRTGEQSCGAGGATGRRKGCGSCRRVPNRSSAWLFAAACPRGTVPRQKHASEQWHGPAGPARATYMYARRRGGTAGQVGCLWGWEGCGVAFFNIVYRPPGGARRKGGGGTEASGRDDTPCAALLGRGGLARGVMMIGTHYTHHPSPPNPSHPFDVMAGSLRVRGHGQRRKTKCRRTAMR